MKTDYELDENKPFIHGSSRSLWLKYTNFVENATKGRPEYDEGDITYWREKLFITFITYLMPVCLIAVVPGVFMALKVGNMVIAGFDLSITGFMIAASLTVGLNFVFRKVFVIILLYAVAVFFLVYLGLYGPGLIYLLAISTFIALTFSRLAAYSSIAINLLICVLCSFIISFKLFNSPLIAQSGLGVWVAISSNVIFLSIVSVILIGHAINNLEKKIIKAFLLKNELKLASDEKLIQTELLMESEAHYKSLFQHSPSPMWILDLATLQFLQVNDSAIQNYGYANEEFLNMTLKDLKFGKESDLAIEDLIEGLKNDLLTGNTSSPAKITQHRRKNQEHFYVEVNFTAIPFKGREALLVVARDMTMQLTFIEAIEIQNAKLSEIAWIQSHVVRAPLARIMGLVDLIIRDNEEKQDKEILSYLSQSANELDDIVQTITVNSEQIKLSSIIV